MAQTGRIIRDNEIYLGSYHYKIAGAVSQRVISAFPPKQITGEYSYANQEILSSWVIKDQRGGIGVEEMDEAVDAKRCWASDLQLGYRGHLPLPRLATSVTIPTPTYDGTPVFANFNGSLYMGKGSTLSKLNAGRTAWTTVKTDFAAKIVDLIVGPNNMLYIYLDDIGFGASDVLLLSSDAEVSTASETAVKLKELTATGGGTLRIKFDLKTSGTSAVYANVRRNGVAVGSEQSTTSGTYVNKSQDIAGWSNGDYIQLYLHVQSGGGETAYAQNFRVYGTQSHLYWYMNPGEIFTQANVGDASLGVFWDAKQFKLDDDGNFWYTATPNSATPTWTSTGGITNIKSGDIKRLEIGPDASGNDIIYASTTSVVKAYSFSDGIWTDSYVKLPSHPTGGMGFLTWRNGIYVSYGLDTLKYVPITAIVDAVGLSRDDGLPQEYNGEVVYFADGDAYLIALVDASKTSGSSKSGVYTWDGIAWQHLWSPPTTLIEDCEDAWNELVDADVTASLDTTDFQVGAGSAKFVVAAAAAAGDILATELIASKDLSQHNSVSLRVKSTVALDASDLQLLLDNTAQCASPLETLNIPAVAANTWTKVVLTLAAASSDTAIVSVGIKMAVDKGAFTLNLDQIEGQTYDGAMNSAIVSSASSGYALYFDHDSKVYYIDLQRGIRNINKLPAVATYASSGIHISPWFDAGSAKDSKTAKRLVLYCRGMSANETIIVKYRINHTYTDYDTGWTTLGTITSNGKTTYNVGSGAGFAFDDIQFRFDLARGSTNTNTPDFTAVLEYLKRKTLWAWSFVIDASGNYDNQTPRQQETSLNTAVEAALLQEFTFRSETDESETKWVFVQPFSYETQTGEQHHSQFQVTVIEP